MKPHLPVQLFLAVLLHQSVLLSPAGAATLTLSVAASMTDAFREIIALFSLAYPEAELAANFGSSGSLAKQIEQGAPVDLYVSADPDWMSYLAERDLIEPGSTRIFAYNRLVLVSTNRFSSLDLAQLVELERIALGTPRSVPAGRYARQALEARGIYRVLEQSRKLIFAKDVRQALLYADRGEVDGAFVYATDAALARQARTVLVVPGELYDRVSYPVGLTASGADKEMAGRFLAFLDGEQVVAVLEKFGFEPVAAD